MIDFIFVSCFSVVSASFGVLVVVFWTGAPLFSSLLFGLLRELSFSTGFWTELLLAELLVGLLFIPKKARIGEKLAVID
jgi:nicotinamide riboside transporter PnuC